MKYCPACNSTNLEPGIMGSSTLWLDKQSAWSRAVSGAQIKVIVCLDCGHVSLWVLPEELKSLLGN